MSDKVMKIAGKDLESLTRGILVSNRGELIPDDGSLEAYPYRRELARGKRVY